MKRSIKKTADDRKFRELILFISERSEGDSRFGAVKLNKILFFSDFFAYLKLGKSITGQAYRKLDWGPAPRQLLPVLRAMREEGAITEKIRNYFGKEQRVTVAIREPDLSLFTAEEIALVTDIIERCWDDNATEVSGLSHRFIGWQAAEDGEDIPYETILLTKVEPNARAARTGRKLEALAKKCQAQNGETA